MPDRLLTVYIVPAGDGCRVAAAHCSIESAEGFGARFRQMTDTLTVIDSRGETTVSDEQALEAVKRYCHIKDPGLESIVSAGQYPVYWEVSSGTDSEVVVLFRSYTGAQVRYYVDRTTGETYVTESVPGVTSGEVRTEERLNVWDYPF